MKFLLLSEHRFGALLVRYLQPEGTKRCELQLLPADRAGDLVEPRDLVEDRPEIDHLAAHFKPVHGSLPHSLVQLKLAEDDAGWGFAPGVTLTESKTTAGLEYVDQQVRRTGPTTVVETTLRDAGGRFRCRHDLSWTEGESGVRCRVAFFNDSAAPLSLELLTSFVLNGVSPFVAGNSTPRLALHRFRSWWSLEGRVDAQSLEALNLERSWIGYGSSSERFGQVGTMPVRRWFPTAAIEDVEAGVVWAAQLAWPGSWQMEVTRSGDRVNLCGGLADREFGHWLKTVPPGESFISPEARLTAVSGDVDAACQAVTSLQRADVAGAPAGERDLPVTFNEWCTSWGSPTHENVLAIARRLVGSGVRYIVIDDGWAVRPPDVAIQSNGDWIVDETRFPGGLRPTCDALRELGFIPGIWFEFEVINPGARAWKETAHMVRRDGRPLQVGSRRFWDFTDPWVEDYLTEKVIHLLRDNGIGYLKVDYNDNIGIGCDHSDSLGEGLRRHVEGVQRFFQKLRREIPELVIENCSSGGHRLEPAMQGLCAMGSFSDAHETVTIPIIARNLQRLILPRQSLIWAVLHATDSPQRLVYSLAATFLGRMCLSGEIHDLDEAQMDLVRRATALAARCAPVIDHGVSTFLGSAESSYVDPVGWQAVVRRHHRTTLVVVHHFESPADAVLRLPIPADAGKIIDQLIDPSSSVERVDHHLHYTPGAAFSGAVFLLES